MAETTGNFNVETWEGDGEQRSFPLGESATPPASVTEDVKRYPVGRHGIDTNFRWSYDESSNALIVEGDPPAEGAIIVYTYQPKPHTPVDGEEWTTITLVRE